MNKKDIEKVLAMLERQEFYDWYCIGGKFDNYITGLGGVSISRSEILNYLAKMLGYPEFKWEK